MKNLKYIVIVGLTFLLYGNTLFHDFALDDKLVITANEYTLSGIEGVDDIFKQDFFSGLFERKNTNLLAGGRYRPVSVALFALEWDLIVGTPFDGIDKSGLEKKMNNGADSNKILPSQKLLKELSVTIHTENNRIRKKNQNRLLNKNPYLSNKEKEIILNNLEEMNKKRGLFLFVAHFINVLLYALTVLVLFRILNILFKNVTSNKGYLSIPFVASILFLVHPIHTEVVANIKGLDEILSLLGSLLAMFLILRYLETRKIYHLALSFVLFLMGIFSKEIAIVFIAIIPLTIYFFVDTKQKMKDIVLVLIPLVIASVIYVYVRQIVVGVISFDSNPELMNNSFLGMNFMERYATIFYTLLLYLKLLFFPHPLTYDYYPYHIPVMNWTEIWPLLGLLLYVGLGIYALFGIKRKKIISYGILFYLIAISPVSNVIFPIGVFMSERFLYIPSIGFAIIVAYIVVYKIRTWTKSDRITEYIKLGLIIVLTLFSLKTFIRNRVWKNDFILFTHDVKISSKSAKSNTSAGGLLMEEALKSKNKEVKNKYLDRSIKHLHRAVEIHPTYVDALILLGNAKWERYQSIDSAFKYYELVLKRYPKFDRVYFNLFNSEIRFEFEKGERADKNLEILNQVKKYDPENYELNYYFGRIYGRFKNDLETSKHYFEKALTIDSTHIDIYKDLGVVYGISKQFDLSVKALEKAILLDPKDPGLKVNLALTLIHIGESNKALKVMDEAFQINYSSSNASVLVNLGGLYNRLNQNDKARICYIKAQNLNPELFKDD